MATIEPKQALTAKKNANQGSNALSLKSISAFAMSKWYWFVISLIITLSAATYYLMKTTPLYTRTAALLIKNDDKSTEMTSIDMSELGIGSGKTNLENEMRIIQSPNLMAEVVSRLDLNNRYQVRTGLRDKVLYKESPVIFNIVDSVDPHPFSFHFKLNDEGKIEINNVVGLPAPDKILASYGETIKLGGIRIQLLKPEWNTKAYAGWDIQFTHSTVKGTAKTFAAAISAKLNNAKSSIIDISTTSPSVQEADDILVTLIQVYNERWIEDKNQIAVSTSRFIDERLDVIQGELGTVESDISSYKSAHLMPSVEETASMYLEQSSAAQAAIMDLNNQISMAEMVRSQLSRESFDQPLPTNTGIINADIQSAIGQFNAIVLERNRLLETTSDYNPIVKDRTQALRTLKDNIILSVNSYIATLRAQLGNARRQASASTSRLAANPNQAKYLLGVERQQKVKESLYLFLLQKREENELTQAFTAYNTSMVEEPYGSMAPTFPEKSKILLIAFLIGLAIPIVIFIIRENLDTKIRGKKDLAPLKVPYLGEIPLGVEKRRGLARLKKKDPKEQKRKILVTDKGRDAVNEAFRVLRTNLEFMGIPEGGKKCEVISLTSANPGSGKTFITVNLAKVLALRGKRVLIIDLDIRKGSLSRMIGKPETGITDYLAGKTPADGLIIKGIADCPMMDAIGIGAVPPNPSELLLSDRLDKLVNDLKENYDYILLDCPPVEIVSDAKIINRLVDITIFVVRAGLLEKDELPNIQGYYDENRYRNMAILLNATDINSGYGYHRYGYHYGYGHNYGYAYGYSGKS